MKYISTRNKNLNLDASSAILQGLSKDKGLFILENPSDLQVNLEDCLNMNYQELAYEILSKYLNDFTAEQTRTCISNAYTHTFSSKDITPTVKVKNDYILELFHGPTSAFKDVALQILPHLLTTSLKIQGSKEEIIILTATSGDTGKAALEGFKDVDNVRIIVFYPKDGVSDVQKKQMLTSEGKNCFVIGVNGNFDDCQRKVKECFVDEELKEYMEKNHQKFSSANSINIGRLIPQIVYYFKAYLDLVNKKEIDLYDKVNVSVPTGNFGDILAGYLAKQMGCPIETFICASNENNVLTEFIQTGIYNAKRVFKKTNSPSMDIVVSSNLERLLYLYCKDDSLVTQMMNDLQEKGSYELTSDMKARLQNEFFASYTTQVETKELIKEVYEKENYLLDPHTAVAYKGMLDFKKENRNNYKTIVLSTASPYKFMDTVLNSISESKSDEFTMMEECEQLTNVKIPNNLKNLQEKENLHNTNVEISEMKNAILNILGEKHD